MQQNNELRDRHTESIGRGYSKYFWLTFQRFCKNYHYFTLYCITRCMVDDEPVVTGFCISRDYFLVDLCDFSNAGDSYCIVNNQLPDNQSGDCEPGKEFKN